MVTSCESTCNDVAPVAVFDRVIPKWFESYPSTAPNFTI